MTVTCRNCTHWHPNLTSVKDGECRADPPTHFLVPLDQGRVAHRTAYRPVAPDTPVCGRYGDLKRHQLIERISEIFNTPEFKSIVEKMLSDAARKTTKPFQPERLPYDDLIRDLATQRGLSFSEASVIFYRNLEADKAGKTLDPTGPMSGCDDQIPKTNRYLGSIAGPLGQAWCQRCRAYVNPRIENGDVLCPECGLVL